MYQPNGTYIVEVAVGSAAAEQIGTFATMDEALTEIVRLKAMDAENEGRRKAPDA